MPGAAKRAWKAWRAEGSRGLLYRLRARAREKARCSAFRASTPDAIRSAFGAFPLLNFLPFPPAPERGGVSVALSARLEEELLHRPIALLYHDGWRWRLEARRGSRRLGWRAPRSPAPGGAPARESELPELLRTLAGTLGARGIHIETVAGLHPATFTDLACRVSLVLSTHDFALYCPRANVLEEPQGAFCGFSADLGRCGRCLGSDRAVSPEFPALWRVAARALLERSAALVHPSDFVRRTIQSLFPDAGRVHQVTIAPAVATHVPGPRQRVWPPRRIAFVGQAERHKGILEFEQLVALDRAGEARVWAVAGAGDSAVLGRLRALGVELLGAYLPGRLPSLLRSAEIDLALLLSRFPETHSLTLDECLAAGVPVLATPVGALADRVTELGAGWLAEAGTGVDGLSRMLSSLAGNRDALAALRPASPPRPDESASGHLKLYERLGFLGRS